MSNSKWRKVLGIVAELGIEFRVAFVGGQKYGLSQTLKNPILNESHIGDGCLIGGPITYKEIFGLQLLRYENLRNPKNGANYKDEEKSLRFRQTMESLGKYPIEVTEEHIYIHGYEQ